MTKEDKLTLTYFNNIVVNINKLCNKIGVQLLNISKNNGEFLFAEDLNAIEGKLYQLSQMSYVKIDKRDWFNLSTLSYLDINRWENLIDRINKSINGYNQQLFPRNNLYPRSNLYSFKKGV